LDAGRCLAWELFKESRSYLAVLDLAFKCVIYIYIDPNKFVKSKSKSSNLQIRLLYTLDFILFSLKFVFLHQYVQVI
jgi:hypothetical protein